MAHGYRILQHWNQWLVQQFLGEALLETEQHCLARMLQRHYGKHALLIGVPHQHALLSASQVSCHSLISPLINKEKMSCLDIESDFHELPILTGSIDLVILPHTLELIDNPRQLLAEACRVIKPEGLIVIAGFNPYSAWGMQKMLAKHKKAPWQNNFIHAHKIKNWLKLAEFALEKQVTALYRPPIMQPVFFQKINFLENIGYYCLPMFGGIYILLARAKVIPLTPIRLKWKQKFSPIHLPTTISGHVAR